MDMKNLSILDCAESRSISPENFKGEKGKGAMAVEGRGQHAARELGRGWKISPSVKIEPHSIFELADIKGPGTIESMWMAPFGTCRFSILRIYWDGQEHPSVECPLGDFFACGWGKPCYISSLAVCVNPELGFNSYWQMPFRKKCRITLENINEEPFVLYYSINYSLGEVEGNAAYFHAAFSRVNPLPYKKVYTILDGVSGKGRYVGTYMAWGVNNCKWWGEGEVKFFLDGDRDFPTICGTGTEDYFGGAFNFEDKETNQYREFTTPYSGLPQVIRPDGLYQSQARFGMYRWHITDPVRFREDIRVTVQALGWRSGGRFLPLQDDISSVAYWYQSLPSKPLKQLPDKDSLEII